MTEQIPTRLEDLVEELLPWASLMPTIRFYIYGSRVRGDHRPDSDVDVYFDTSYAALKDRLELQIQETDDHFRLPQKYRRRIWNQSKRHPELCDRIRSAPVKYQKGNILCVYLPATWRPTTPN